MKYARHWGAIANHSGDAYFDFVYRCDWPNTLNELGEVPPAGAQGGRRVAPPRGTAAERGLARGPATTGACARFLDAVWKKAKLSGAEVHAIMNVCMAATYDPDPQAPLGFRLPFHLETGELIEARWQRWLEHDPVLLVPRYARNLRTLSGHLHRLRLARPVPHPLRQRGSCRAALAAARIAHRYEEFDDDHSDIDYRMDVSLPFLYRALQP